MARARRSSFVFLRATVTLKYPQKEKVKKRCSEKTEEKEKKPEKGRKGTGKPRGINWSKNTVNLLTRVKKEKCRVSVRKASSPATKINSKCY